MIKPSPSRVGNSTLSWRNSRFHGTRNCTVMFKRVHHWSLSWARWIHSTPSILLSLRPIFILSYHLCLDLLNIVPFVFFSENFICIFYLLILFPCTTHPILELIILMLFGEEHKLWSSCTFLQPPVSSSLLSPNIISALFSNTLNLCSSLNVRSFHTHTKQVKLYFKCYVQIFKF